MAVVEVLSWDFSYDRRLGSTSARGFEGAARHDRRLIKMLVDYFYGTFRHVLGETASDVSMGVVYRQEDRVKNSGVSMHG